MDKHYKKFLQLFAQRKEKNDDDDDDNDPLSRT